MISWPDFKSPKRCIFFPTGIKIEIPFPELCLHRTNRINLVHLCLYFSIISSQSTYWKTILVKVTVWFFSIFNILFRIQHFLIDILLSQYSEQNIKNLRKKPYCDGHFKLLNIVLTCPPESLALICFSFMCENTT